MRAAQPGALRSLARAKFRLLLYYTLCQRIYSSPASANTFATNCGDWRKAVSLISRSSQGLTLNTNPFSFANIRIPSRPITRIPSPAASCLPLRSSINRKWAFNSVASARASDSPKSTEIFNCRVRAKSLTDTVFNHGALSNDSINDCIPAASSSLKTASGIIISPKRIGKKTKILSAQHSIMQRYH